MKLLPVFSALLCATPLFGADITMNSQLASQGKSRTISPKPLGQWSTNVSVGGEEFQNIKLLKKEASVYGDGSRMNLGIKYGITDWADLGVSANVLTEKKLEPSDAARRPLSKGEFTVELGFNLYDSDLFSLSITPFLEVGGTDKNRFLFKSKDTTGAIISGSVGIPYLSLTTNLYGRYRPLDIYDNYRISNDFGASAMIRSQIGFFGIYGELAEQNTRIMDFDVSDPEYETMISQQHSVGVDFQVGNSEIALFTKRAMSNKIIGVPGESFGLQISLNFGQEKEREDLPPTIPELDQNPGLELSPGEKIYRLDNLREDIANRKDKAGTEMDGFNLLEEGPAPVEKKPSREELVKEADREIQELIDIQARIDEKYENFPDMEGESPALIKDPVLKPSLSH